MTCHCPLIDFSLITAPKSPNFMPASRYDGFSFISSTKSKYSIIAPNKTKRKLNIIILTLNIKPCENLFDFLLIIDN